MCSKGRRQPHVFFVLSGVSDSSWEGMSGLSPSGCLSAAALPAWPRWSRAVLWNQSSNMMLWSQLERQLWLWAEPSHSVRLGSLSAPRPSSLGCSSSAQHRAAQHYLLICRCGFFWDTVLATDFREFSRWMFQTSCTVSKSALSVKIHRHLLCLCWTVSLLHSSLQCNQKFWFQDKCHFWRNCGMEIPSCLCFHSSLMQNVYLLVSYYLQLCFTSFYIPAWKYLRAHVTCIHTIGAKNWTCCWQAAHSVDSAYSRAPLKAVRATQTTSPQHPAPTPPPSSHRRLSFSWAPEPGCGLWMSATSWLSALGFAGDWLVVEVQYQGLSVSSSFHFLLALSAGWAAVSGTNILWLTLFGLKMKGSPSE